MNSSKKILILGASGTLGTAIASELMKSDFHLTLQYRSQRPVLSGMPRRGQVQFAKRTLTRMPDLEIWPRSKYDVLINCIGVNTTSAKVDELGLAEWNKHLFINLTVPFLITKRLLPYMKINRWGRIVHVSSIFGVRGARNRAAYVASKHGLEGLMKATAGDGAEYNITCNSICPGPVESKLLHSIAKRETQSPKGAEAWLLARRQGSPIGRFVHANEIAVTVAFLISDAASAINGQSLIVDGGITACIR